MRLMRDLSTALDHSFEDPGLLRQALTHGSVSSGPTTSYQRLEFLGDRVLGLVIADLLLANFPDEDEGALAKRLAALVSAETLADVASEIGLGKHIRVRRDDSSMATAPGLLADVCEAVIAALYQDGGLSVARAFIARYWTQRLKDTPQPPTDPKTLLQEWAQARGYELPDYVEIKRAGPDHAPSFTVSVQVGVMAPVEGQGATKRAAEKLAAAKLLEQLHAHD